MNREWNLDILYRSTEDEKFKKDLAALPEAQKALHALVAEENGTPDGARVEAILAAMERISALASDLMIYLFLRKSVNTEDGEIMAQTAKLQRQLSEGAADDAAAMKLLGKIKDPETLGKAHPLIAAYSALIRDAGEKAKHLLSNEEEALAAAMDATGGGAWENLHSYLTSTLKVDYDGGVKTLSEIRALAMSPDETVREKAYRAELAAYEKVKDPVAFALNNIKNQVILLSGKRGYASPLDEALAMAKMKRETLDAMMEAIRDSLPVFRKYLKKKGELLHRPNGLRFYDLFAPLGELNRKFTVDEARDYLLDCFGEPLPEIAAVMREAFDNEWIDFYPRSGKEGGAFDCGVFSAGQSRIMTNFTGDFDNISTLAHELGHSFHDRQVSGNRIMNTDYPMPVAETASTFNEIFLCKRALEKASEEEKLSLLEADLCGNTQCIVDIYSRYLFETAVFDRASDRFLMADDLCGLMLDAQRSSYGDGMDDAFRHPYMWLCKGHYYSSSLSFYNFPYAFGQLFATGLYALYEEDPAGFMPRYREMLRLTPVHTIEEDGAMMGVDLTKKDFWKKCLSVIEDNINRFLAM